MALMIYGLRNCSNQIKINLKEIYLTAGIKNCLSEKFPIISQLECEIIQAIISMHQNWELNRSIRDLTITNITNHHDKELNEADQLDYPDEGKITNLFAIRHNACNDVVKIFAITEGKDNTIFDNATYNRITTILLPEEY